MDLQVNAVVLLFPDNGLKVSSSQLRDMGPTDLQGIPYQTYSSDRLPAGSDLRLTVSGRPGGGAGLIFGTGSNLVIGLLAFGAALILGGVWLYTRTRAGRKEDLAEEVGDIELLEFDGSDDTNTLLDALLALDDRYQAGELPEGAYLNRRAELKAQLRKIMGEGKQGS
jgi:hypothetical protein